MTPDDSRPWSAPVRLSDVQRGERTLALSADAAERKRIADLLDLPRLAAFDADVTVAPWLDGAQVRGRWTADLQQACSVSAEFFDSRLSGEFTVRAVPAESRAAPSPDAEITVDPDAEDPPDVLEGDVVDVGAYLVEHLALELDPFPRAPGAEWRPPPRRPSHLRSPSSPRSGGTGDARPSRLRSRRRELRSPRSRGAAPTRRMPSYVTDVPAHMATDPLVVSVDVMGGDYGPPVFVAGVALAVRRLRGRPVRFLLHGDEALIRAELAKRTLAASHCEVRHTDKVIGAEEKPAQALRRGKGSSLWNAVEAVKSGEAAAAVSGGNTGALMAISKLQLRCMGGLDRPAIVASWPTLRGVSAVLDVGANIDCDAKMLVEFAILGEAFHCAVHGPRDGEGGSCRSSVGILNVGSEDAKGHAEVREAHRLLGAARLDLDYRGFVEGNDIAMGSVDVVVTDGFTGNVALKTAEGMARFFSRSLRETLTSTPLATAGAFVAGGALGRMRARLDPSSVNGGPLLGLKGTVVKSHGGADAVGVANALVVAAELAGSDYLAQIDRNLGAFERSAPPEEPTA